jgi:hypothetical protein
MTKEAVLSLLETDMDDPGSLKDGEYLLEHVIQHSKRALEHDQDRPGLVQALQDWLESRSQPRIFLAVRVVQELRLVELSDEILKIEGELESGILLPDSPEGERKLYLREVAIALAVLDDGKEADSSLRSE